MPDGAAEGTCGSRSRITGVCIERDDRRFLSPRTLQRYRSTSLRGDRAALVYASNSPKGTAVGVVVCERENVI